MKTLDDFEKYLSSSHEDMTIEEFYREFGHIIDKGDFIADHCFRLFDEKKIGALVKRFDPEVFYKSYEIWKKE